MTGELVLCIVSLCIFILGIASRRFGLASLLIISALIIGIGVLDADNPFPYGCIVSIILFVASVILHGKVCGKKSPIYQYSPYNPDGRLTIRTKLLLLMLAAIAALITALSQFFN